MDDLARLTRAGLVHADLSPYNVLWWRDRAWVIDLPQAVDLRQSRRAGSAAPRRHHRVPLVRPPGLDCDGEATFAALLAEAF